jgi:hypothetical protein
MKYPYLKKGYGYYFVKKEYAFCAFFIIIIAKFE